MVILIYSTRGGLVFKRVSLFVFTVSFIIYEDVIASSVEASIYLLLLRLVLLLVRLPLLPTIPLLFPVREDCGSFNGALTASHIRTVRHSKNEQKQL
jgi:hypothetical protein